MRIRKHLLQGFLLVALLVISGMLLLRSDPIIAKYSKQAPLQIDQLTGQYDFNDTEGVWEGQRITSSYYPDNENFKNTQVLGETSNSEKRIEIDLTHQRIYAFEGDNKIYDFPVSTGLHGKTPTGDNYRIWIKLSDTLMTGGSVKYGTYYYLPNVPFTMYIAGPGMPRTQGYGIHGAYWHNNFGQPMSHGCINLRPTDAEQIYYWAGPDLQGRSSIVATSDNPGTRIVIYGKYQYQ